MDIDESRKAEDAMSLACYQAALRENHTLDEADQCAENGCHLGCAGCPWMDQAG